MAKHQLNQGCGTHAKRQQFLVESPPTRTGSFDQEPFCSLFGGLTSTC